jgi:hypothetical protein
MPSNSSLRPQRDSQRLQHASTRSLPSTQKMQALEHSKVVIVRLRWVTPDQVNIFPSNQLQYSAEVGIIDSCLPALAVVLDKYATDNQSSSGSIIAWEGRDRVIERLFCGNNFFYSDKACRDHINTNFLENWKCQVWWNLQPRGTWNSFAYPLATPRFSV